jgi:hypothetical protein
MLVVARIEACCKVQRIMAFDYRKAMLRWLDQPSGSSERKALQQKNYYRIGSSGGLDGRGPEL